MRIETEHEYSGDIDTPYITVTLTAGEAHNLECAARGQLRSLIKNNTDEVFVSAAEKALSTLVKINYRADQWDRAHPLEIECEDCGAEPGQSCEYACSSNHT